MANSTSLSKPAVINAANSKGKANKKAPLTHETFVIGINKRGKIVFLKKLSLPIAKKRGSVRCNVGAKKLP
jgi:hypothetical protein